MDTSALFHNQRNRRPACLSGRDSAQTDWSSTLKTWRCIPTVNTSRLLPLKSAFTPESSPSGQPGKKGLPQRHPPWSLCPLSPVPEAPSFRLRFVPRPASRRLALPSRGLALCLAQPFSPLASPRGVVGLWGRGQLCPDCTTDNPGACAPRGSRGGIPRAPCTPNLTPGRREPHFTGTSAHLHAAYAAVKGALLGASAIRYPRPPASPPARCSHSRHPQP